VSDKDRLIPENELREALDTEADRDLSTEFTPRWWLDHTESELMDIAELRLLLGLPADTDRGTSDLFVRLVRRLVLAERALDVALLPGRGFDHCPCCAHSYHPASGHVSPALCGCQSEQEKQS
jgi:hypothetical protein